MAHCFRWQVLLLWIVSHAHSEAASTRERTILFQNHGGTLPDLAEFTKTAQKGEVEVTAQQTRNRKIEAKQWRIPIAPNDSGPSTSSILANEITQEGWLATHASWVKPVSCEEVAGRPGKSGHDANLMFGSERDFLGGYEPTKVIHQVCIPSSVITEGSASQLTASSSNNSSSLINLHGRVCGPAQCLKNDELQFETGNCKEEHITESDLPGPHYISSLAMRGIDNVIAKDTVGVAQFDPTRTRTGTTIMDQSDDEQSISSSLLGYTQVCKWKEDNEISPSIILQNPLNGYKYTRAPLRVNGIIYGIQANLSGKQEGGNDINNKCSSTIKVPIPNALVEIWQSDIYGRYDREPITPLAQAYLNSGVLDSTNLTLSMGSCRGILRTDSSGRYVADTEVPGSTGPPQNIHFRVSAPGFKTLNTVK
jgi:hypothetical protein